MIWLDHYQKNYYALLMPKSSGAKRGLVEGHCQRGDGFRIMFERLLAQKSANFKIIETGTLRNPGNWKDGQSAKLFTEFVEHYGGTVQSVDIDANAVKTANESVASQQFHSHCGDSVNFLQKQPDLNEVDLFYLDSWDVKWHNDHDSSEHHLKEFLAIEQHLQSGAIVAIDDNSRLLCNGRRTGKGRSIVEYLSDKNIHPVYDAYQIIYQF